MSPDLGMDVICDHLNISVSYLSTLFKKHLDTSFNKELVRIRMEKAKDLLRFSTKKIYEIAQEVGYNDVYYFSHSFKKYSSKTPKDFRNEA
jgi:two-component system response regulator YesN